MVRRRCLNDQMIRYGFSSIGCPDYDVAQMADLARRTGLLGVELRFVRGTIELADLPEFAPSALATTARTFADAGVELVGLGSSVRFSAPHPDERARQRVAATRDIAMAAGLGIGYLRLFGGTLPAGLSADDRSHALDIIAEQLTDVAREARASGVEVLLETHDDFCTGASVLELDTHGLGTEVGILWDTLHSFRNGEALRDTWDALGPRVRHVHVKDATRADASGFDLALTGDGIMPVGNVLDLLTEAGYDGYVNFEWEKGWHPELADPEVAIPHFAAWLDAHGRR